MGFTCKQCNREFKTQQALNSHIGWHNKPKRPDNFATYRNSIRFGTTSGENQYTKAKRLGLPIPAVSEETRRKISEAGKKQIWTEERRKKHSIRMQQVVKDNPESYSSKNVCGRVKNIEYNGVLLTGKWELEVAKWLDRNNIQWKRNIKGFEYFWPESGKIHIYFPDFYLPEYNYYIEVKGYQRDRDLHKWNVVDKLIVFRYNDIKKIQQNILQWPVSPQSYKL